MQYSTLYAYRSLQCSHPPTDVFRIRAEFDGKTFCVLLAQFCTREYNTFPLHIPTIMGYPHFKKS